ncbi:MAG TPA: GumC family protein [Candidatus Solibacter sp.]|nr:GumC family protein [Candidatus Solibacter sp.]
MSEFQSQSGDQAFSISVKELIAIGFRHKRSMFFCFMAVFIGAVLVGLLMPTSYTAHTEILVKRERVDPVISPGQAAPVMVKEEVTEEELNSEVELLESDDVMKQVAVASGLDKRSSLMGKLFGRDDAAGKIAKAAQRLRGSLVVEPMKKTNLISISYSSGNPQQAALVLKNLNDAYIRKHAEVNRPAGQFKFFDQEAERYKSELADAEGQLSHFAAEQGGVAPLVARDQTLARLTEFTATLATTRAEMSATEQKIRTLESQSGAMPSNITTSSRKTDDAQVLQQMKSMLMTLELKRTELLTKYQPTYPLVTEVDKQISDTRASIAKEEAKPLLEETTGQNPTYQYVSTELAKAKADYSALQARAAAMEGIVSLYKQKATELEQKGIQEQDLQRAIKTDEENYLLYQHKREEARMSDMLDQTHILNVAVAQAPAVPVLPTGSRMVFVVLGLVLGAVMSVGLALALDYFDPSFRTPSEVLSELNIPVLAAVPHRSGGYGASYNSGTVVAEPVEAFPVPVESSQQ